MCVNHCAMTLLLTMSQLALLLSLPAGPLPAGSDWAVLTHALFADHVMQGFCFTVL